MAEDCTITHTEAFAMDDFEINIANAALNKAIKQKNDAVKKGAK